MSGISLIDLSFEKEFYTKSVIKKPKLTIDLMMLRYMLKKKRKIGAASFSEFLEFMSKKNK